MSVNFLGTINPLQVKSLQHLHCKMHFRMIRSSFTMQNILKKFNSTLPQIPVIDIGPVMCGIDDPSVINNICSGANNFGAFQVINHGINDKQILSASKHFLSSSKDKKMVASKGDGIWGYFGLFGEQTQGIPDVKEGTHLRSELSYLRNVDLSKFPLREPNKWPHQKDFPNFRAAIESNFAEVYQTACAISRCISTKLGWESNYFINNIISQFEWIGIFRYHQDQNRIHPNFGVGQHSDPAMFSVVTSDAEGLQIKLPSSDSWVDVPVMEGAVVILINDYLDYITNGYCKSSVHRVLKPTSSDRYSVTTFVAPHFDLEMSMEHIGDGVSDHVRDAVNKNNYTVVGEHMIQQLVHSLGKTTIQKP